MAGNPGVSNQVPETGKLLNSSGEVINIADVLESVYDSENGALKTTATLTGDVTLGNVSVKDHTSDNFQAVNASGEASIAAADGALVTMGAKADTAVTNPAASGSVVGLLKGILTNTKATVLAAGTAVIGKFGLQVGDSDLATENPLPATVVNNITVGTSALPVGASTETTLAAINTATGAKTDATTTDATASSGIISLLKGIFSQVKTVVSGYVDAQAWVTIDTIHNEVHEGETFQATHVFLAVPDDGYVYLHHQAGASTAMHAGLSVLTLGKAYLKTYLNPTLSNAGTQVLVAAQRTDIDPATRTGNVRHTPTITANGTARLTKLIPGGTAAQTRVGVSFHSVVETVIMPADGILTEIQNKSGAPMDIDVSFVWYERNIS